MHTRELTRSGRFQLVLCGAVALGLGACATDVTEVEYQTLTAETPLSWDQFKEKSSVYSEDGNLTYVIEGDIGVNEAALRSYYEDRYLAYTDKSSVATVNGVDAVWNATDKLNITYCVSNNFNERKPRAVADMRAAAAQWMAAANVKLTYVPSKDANCADGYTGVKLNVVSQATGGGLGCFPNYCNHLFMNYNATFTGYSWFGAWTHEVGHTLGLGHEHVNAPCNFNPDSETVRLLTSYDVNSALHYSQRCGSTSTGQMTPTDQAGLVILYGASTSAVIQVLPAEWIDSTVSNILVLG